MEKAIGVGLVCAMALSLIGVCSATTYLAGPGLGSAGFFVVNGNSTQGWAPGGLFGLFTQFINGASVRANYWQSYADANCLGGVSGLSPQNIRAMADDPTQNCERNTSRVLWYGEEDIYAKATANISWTPKHKPF